MNINIDFDGTCVTHMFPEVGKDIGAQHVLKALTDNGHQLILFTMRCDHPDDMEVMSEHPGIEPIHGKFLTDAINWFNVNDIPLWGIQTNPTQHTWTTSPKSFAHYMIDDSALGCPTLFIPDISDRPFVNWVQIAYILSGLKAISGEQLIDCIYKIDDSIYNKRISKHG